MVSHSGFWRSYFLSWTPTCWFCPGRTLRVVRCSFAREAQCFPPNTPIRTQWGRGAALPYVRTTLGHSVAGWALFFLPLYLSASFSGQRRHFFISIKPPWWVQRGRNLYSHCIDKEGFQRSCDMWAREGLESKWDFLPSSRAWSRAPNCLADELSISVWIICRHLQLPSGSGLPLLTIRSIIIRQAHTHTYLYITL